MHGKFLAILNPNNGRLKYNLHFYMLLVGAIRNMSEVQVRKEIVIETGLTHSSYVLRWQKWKKNESKSITHEKLMLLCNYFNQHIPHLNLNSDDMLTLGNEKAKRNYMLDASLSPERLALSK